MKKEEVKKAVEKIRGPKIDKEALEANRKKRKEIRSKIVFAVSKLANDFPNRANNK